MLETFHVLFTTVWVVSSFTLHFCVTLHGDNSRKILAKFIFTGGAIVGGVFVILFIAVQVDENQVIDNVKENAKHGNTDLLSVLAILEVLAVYSLLWLDFLLCGVILDTYMDGVSLFMLVCKTDSFFYRVPMQIGILVLYILLVLFIVLGGVKLL